MTRSTLPPAQQLTGVHATRLEARARYEKERALHGPRSMSASRALANLRELTAAEIRLALRAGRAARTARNAAANDAVIPLFGEAI